MEKIKNNIGIIILITVVVIILVIYQAMGSKSTSQNTSASPSPQAQQYNYFTGNYKLPSYSQPPLNSSGQVDINSENVQNSVDAKATLLPHLPIYIENFQTTTPLKTTLNVYTIPEDPIYLIHVEVYGINYSDPKILDDGNANAQAFVDSFNKIKTLLANDGVDIHSIYFIFGAKPYIQSAADNLIRKYNLL